MISFLKGKDRLTVVIGNRSQTLPVNDERVPLIMELIGEYNKASGEVAQVLIGELELILFPVNQVIKLSDGKFVWDGRKLTLAGDDEGIPALLTERIMEFIEHKYPLDALVNFWKNLKRNPSSESKQAIYDFIERWGITITNSGYMVLYKGVKETSEKTSKILVSGTKGYYRDAQGKARRPNGSFASKVEIEQFLADKGKSDTSVAKYVDCHSGTFDNSPGLVVQMDRANVDTDRNAGCSRGLHVGAHEYASHFGPVLLKVLVNPEDVVSVPYDCECQKIRVSKYFVVEVLSEKEKIQGIYDDEDFAFIQTMELLEDNAEDIPYIQQTFKFDEE